MLPDTLMSKLGIGKASNSFPIEVVSISRKSKLPDMLNSAIKGARSMVSVVLTLPLPLFGLRNRFIETSKLGRSWVGNFISFSQP